MHLKLDDAGHAVVSEGKPVYVHDDGKEVPFDVPDMYGRIIRDGKTVGDLRRKVDDYEGKLKAYDGLDDPEAARKALELAQNFKESQLAQAGKVEEIKTAANRAAEDRVAAASKKFAEDLALTQKERDHLRTELYDEKIGGSFSRSKFIAEKMAVPTDMIQAQFGKNFRVEEGKIVAHDSNGNPIYSRANPGSLADFDEALETIVNGYIHRDSILKGTGSTGSGARPANNGAGGKKTVSRADYERMSVDQKIVIAREAAKGETQILDRSAA